MKIILSLALLVFTTLGGTLAALGAPLARAQEATESAVQIPQDLSQESIEELVAKLDPDQVEALSSLVRLLNESAGKAAEPAPAQVGMVESIRAWTQDFGAAIASYIEGTPAMLAGIGKALASLFEGRGMGAASCSSCCWLQ